MDPEVVVVGSCMTDLVSRVPRFPKAGETLHGHEFAIGFGGKGANQCVVAARLGANAAMVGKLGKDTFGDNYLQNLRDSGVNVDHLGRTDKAATGVAPIAVNDEGQNSIVIVSGANLLLDEADVLAAEGLIQKAQVLVCQLETRPETSLAALKLARNHQVTTILNPAPAVENLDREIFQYCDIVCPNESEAELLTGHPVTTLEEAHKAVRWFLELGAHTAIVTLGEKGVVFASAYNHTPNHVPVQSCTPVDTTGAGDAFVGALAFFLAKFPGLELAESIRRACAVATVSVQAAGTQTSYPWRKDLPNELFSPSELAE